MRIPFGSPSLYITISPNDISHILAYFFCLKDKNSFNYESDEINDTQFRTHQASKNPVSLSIFFHTLINAILKHLFGWENVNNNGIFGPLNSYYGMVETQGRGTLHIHLLLWLKGFPDSEELFEKIENDQAFKCLITDYINKIINTDCFPYPSSCENIANTEDCSYFQNNNNKKIISINDNEFLHYLNHDFIEAIIDYQLHKHSFSCFKNGPLCRYRKPDLVANETIWVGETGSFIIKKENGMINNFNILLNGIVKSNCDVQFLTTGNEGLAISQYICNYITKNSVGIDNILILQQAAIKKTIENPLSNLSNSLKSLNENQIKCRDFLIRLVHEINKCSQVAASEISTKLLKLPMSYSSHSFTKLFTYNLHKAYKEFKILEQDQKNDNTTNLLIEKNIIISNKGDVNYDLLNNYIFRHESLNNLNLYDFVSYLKCTKTAKDIEFPFTEGHKFYKTRGMMLKKLMDIPSIFGPFFRKPVESSSIEEIENYENSICLLFQPFRSFCDLNYTNMSLNLNEFTKKLIKNIELLHRSKEEGKRKAIQNQILLNANLSEPITDFLFEDIDEDIPLLLEQKYLQFINMSDCFEECRKYNSIYENAINDLNNSFELNINDTNDNFYSDYEQKFKFSETWKYINNELFNDSCQKTILNTETNYEPSLLMINRLNISFEELKNECIEKFTLNQLQKLCFTIIIDHITNPLKEQLIFYIGGEGGTGKSRIIQSLTYFFEKSNIIHKLKKMAFCATAAWNIGGRTIHSMLKINALNSDKLSLTKKCQLEQVWNGTLCQVIDEISFCTSETLNLVDNLQKQILNNNKLFGGLNTIFFGDFYQHLAIGGRIFESEIWKNINHTIILKEQMRAAEDIVFQNVLKRLRERKCTKDDFEYFNTHLLKNIVTDFEKDEWKNAQFVIPERILGFHINNISARNFSKQNKTPLIIIIAYDVFQGDRPKNSNIRNAIIEKTTVPNSTNKCELYRIIELCIGSKVMLTKNIQHFDEYGYTNGCHGTVYDVVPFPGMKQNTHYLESHNIIIYDKPPISIYI